MQLKYGHVSNKFKVKKLTVFFFPPANPINYIKNLHQTPACKNSDERKWKKYISKQNKEGDEGSPSEKKNVKCQDKEPENIFENNLTGPNEYSKGYQTERKIHFPDLLPF